MHGLLALLLLASPGADLPAKFECNRCHRAELWAEPPPEKQCLGCHEQIRSGAFKAAPEHLARWQARLVSLNHVPSLVGVGARFQRSWIEKFLSEPHDLRPALPAMMPRLGFGPGEAAALAGFLAPPDEGGSVAGDAARGRDQFGALGCGMCHAFTGADVPAIQPAALTGEVVARGLPLAPDLRFTRERFRPSMLARWIRQPTEIKKDSAMPALPMSEADAVDMAAWISSAPLAALPEVAVPETPKPLDRPVRWAEVEARVFKHICWHCHSDPAFAVGDGGPGNTGGFGFAARALNLATYQGISSGLRDRETGARRSVFAPGPDGKTPLLVAALMARHAEVAGRPVPGVRGMPLGLPPIPLEDIQRVVTWVAQGRPR